MTSQGLKILLAFMVVFTAGILNGLALTDANSNAVSRALLLAANVITMGRVVPLVYERQGARLIGMLIALGGACYWGWTLVRLT